MRRARRAFWLLAVLAVIAVGTLSRSLTASPGAGTGVAVALSATVLAISLVLAARIPSRVDRDL